MSLAVSPHPVPLQTDDNGVMRVGGTRVSLESVVYAYREGATAEQIVEDFPSLDLADVHLVISYYLRHFEDVNAYLAQQRRETDALKTRITADFKTQVVRQRIEERRSREAASDVAPDRG